MRALSPLAPCVTRPGRPVSEPIAAEIARRGMMMTAAEAVGIDRARPTIPVKPSFIAAFTLAQIGAYVSFMPVPVAGVST